MPSPADFIGTGHPDNGQPADPGLYDPHRGREHYVAPSPDDHDHAVDQVTGLQATLDSKVTSMDISTIDQVTQAEYDALEPPDEDTFYVVVGE